MWTMCSADDPRSRARDAWSAGTHARAPARAPARPRRYTPTSGSGSTASASTRPGCDPSRSARSTTCGSCRSRARAICGTTIRSGSFAVPRERGRAHPRLVGHDRQADRRRVHARRLELFAEVNARCLAMLGAEPGMMLHNAYGYGLFTGGLGFHYGAERLGMTVVPGLGRDDGAAVAADRRLPPRRDRLHAELCAHARPGVRASAASGPARSACASPLSAPSRGRESMRAEIDARPRRPRRATSTACPR